MMKKASGALPPDNPYFAPGLKRRGARIYWLPQPKDIKAGYGLKSIRIPDCSELEAAEICRKEQADLIEWRGDNKSQQPGTWNWIIEHYKSDPESPMNRLHPRKGRPIRAETRRQYEYQMRVIKKTIGKRDIVSTTGPHLLKWYDKYAKGGHFAKAYSVMGQIKRLASYAKFMGHDPARKVVGLFDTVSFHGSIPRTIVWDFDQIMPLVNKALEMGYLSIAITTLAQFEFTERRIHVLGEWEGGVKKGKWRGGWVWEGIKYRQRVGIDQDWQIRYFQDKVQPLLRSFDLHDTPALLELIETIPEKDRTGAVIISESTGRPWNKRSYQRTFREIAQAAKLPAEFWSMDMRASAATEADDIPGVTMSMLQGAGGWSNPQTVGKYRRNRQRQAGAVVKIRQENRK